MASFVRSNAANEATLPQNRYTTTSRANANTKRYGEAFIGDLRINFYFSENTILTITNLSISMFMFIFPFIYTVNSAI